MPKLALIGLPFDHHSSFLKGASEAPPLIRAALHSESSNLWTESGIDLGQTDLWVDAGDLEAPAHEAEPPIEAALSALLDRGLVPVSLGGIIP